MKDSVNILGTDYKIVIDDEWLYKNDYDGNHAYFEKKIMIRSPEKMSPSEPKSCRLSAFREVLRHEIFHAYFRQAGIEKYQMDEELIQWLAIQFPKIAKTFSECECAE